MKRYLSVFAVFAFFLLNNQACAFAEEHEYQVKAAFIYNFMKFVEWPQESPAGSSPTLNFCTLGDDPFGDNVSIFEGKSVGGRKIVVRKVNAINNVRVCNVLYVPESEKARLHQIVETAKGSYVLTVGDTDGFAQKGVIINMFIEKEKVRFEINIDAAKRAGLRIDPRLLKLSRIVRD